MPLNSLPLWMEAAAKAVVYIALLLAVGAGGVRWLLLPRARGLSEGELQRYEQRLARLVLTAALALTGALALRLAAHTTAVFGFAESLSIEAFRIVALESRWGSGWRLQMLGAVAAVSAALVIRIHRGIGWLASTGAVIACCFAVPLLGHAAGEPRRLAFHASHVLGAGLWLGSLASVLIVGRPRAPLLRRFAPLALSGAAVLLVSGIVTAVEYVGSIWNLWTTAYGRTLSIKLGLFGAVVGCGYFNWRRWRPDLSSSGGASADAQGSERIEVVEATLALAIVLVTALLTELEHP